MMGNFYRKSMLKKCNLHIHTIKSVYDNGKYGDEEKYNGLLKKLIGGE